MEDRLTAMAAPPTHVFIGGSGGRLAEIITAVKNMNPHARIVITAVSLETIAEADKVIKENDVTDVSVEQLSVSRGTRVGDHTIMLAQNPVYIFAFTLDCKRKAD